MISEEAPGSARVGLLNGETVHRSGKKLRERLLVKRLALAGAFPSPVGRALMGILNPEIKKMIISTLHRIQSDCAVISQNYVL